ncbi:MAG: hypothetical protein CSA11_00900 [Chloroflexi bacterium]|nr:MAG: hypothetical protein CSA11_00900 [Chloroflexota bacterium]
MDELAARKSYWQIDPVLNCPVVGTCLTLTEQKKILKKSGADISSLTDHQIHRALVQSGNEEGAISRRIQRMLESKYKTLIAELGDCDEETFLTEWQKGLRRGEIGGLLWIGASSRHLSSTAVNRVFGDYHMHTHGQGIIIRKQLQQMDNLKRKNKRLTDSLKQVRAEKQQTAQALQTIKREKTNLTQEVSTLHKKIEALQNRPKRKHLQQANSALEDQIRLLENKLRTQEETVATLREENGRLATIVAEQDKINQRLRAEFNWLRQQTNPSTAEENAACAICPQRDSCPYRVLIVGGLNTLRPYYQSLVEDSGGEFKHFDGRQGSSERALRPMIGWADIILCPIDFNSHNATLTVKKLCKKMQKPYHMLPNSSMSHISQVLSDVSADMPVTM